MLLNKYRVSDVAKDLGMPAKELIDLLTELFNVPKKTATVLEEEEMDVLFERLTSLHASDNLDAYFAEVSKRKPTPKPAAPETPAAPAEAPAKKPAAKKPAAKPAAAGETPAEASAKKPAAKKPAAKPDDKPAGKPLPRPVVPAPVVTTTKPIAPPAQPAKKEKKGGDRPTRGPIERRTVDTRTQQEAVGEKYNEHYDELAQGHTHRGDNGPRKQKLNQKSQQYRKPHARRETEAERMARIQAERQKKQATIQVGETIVVSELALRLKATAAEVVKKLFLLGVMATPNQEIDFDTAFLVAEEFHTKVEREVIVTIEDRIIDTSEDTDENLQPRDPVVVVMGHVDHGKTSILDCIRNTRVTAGEAGGITQHIGAYRVDIGGQQITFLDTPGHAAFTAMRARGAQATDIAILVVAADDGIMPQTIEAINHAKAAGVSIIVAINKMDKPTANPDRVMQQLTEYGLVPEEWGGDVICVPVSALTGMNIDKLLETVLLVAEMAELRANPDRAAKGIVIEARLDKGRGPIATVLVQNGTLHDGDIVVAGTAVGRVRTMTDDRGRKIKEAGPSVPVEIMGLDTVPNSGDTFDAVSDEHLAHELVEQRRAEAKEEVFKQYQKVTLDNLFDQMQQGEMKELRIIVKADVQGSVEAVRQSLEKLTNEEVRVTVIHGAVGAVNESDVMLAEASNAIIVGFNVRPESLASAAAERSGVEMRLYRVIYDCIEDVTAAMKGMLAPKTREVSHGRVEVRQVFKLSSVGTIAGCYVLEGKVYRNDLLRVVRDGIIIADDKMASLRRGKDDQKEVAAGYECGIGLERFNDFKEGDIFETYIIEEYRE